MTAKMTAENTEKKRTGLPGSAAAGKERNSGCTQNGLRRWLCAAIGALFLGTSLEWGRQLDAAGNVNFTAYGTWLSILAAAAVAAPCLALLFSAGGRRTPEAEDAKRPVPQPAAPSRRFSASWLLTALLLFLAWFAVFLAAYPGFFAYDATEELEQVLSGEYVTRHPLLHVLLLGGTVARVQALTGSWNAGIAAYVLCQMAALALLFAWMLCRLCRPAGKRLQYLLSLLFLALFPVIPMFALCTCKDTLYSAGLLAVTALLLTGDASRKKGRAGWDAGLCAGLFCMAVFRNNGFYVFLGTVPFLLLWAGRARWRRMAVCAAAALLLCLGTRGLLNAALSPVSTDAQETFTVPIQQLARAWKYSPELFSEEDRAALFAVLPEEALERYDPKLSDPVKIDFRTEAYREAPLRFWKLWAAAGIRAPFTYLNAWLMTSYGFWYPFTVPDAYNGTREYRTSSYFSCETEEPGVRRSYFPWLEEQYQKLSWDDAAHRMPVVSWLFSPGFLCWLYVLTGLYLLSRKGRRPLCALAPVYLNWLTVLLGPACLVRYVLIFWFALPLLPVVIKIQMCYTHQDGPAGA